MIPRAMTATVGYQTSLGVAYDMYCCRVCSSSAGHRFSPNIHVLDAQDLSRHVFGAHQAKRAPGN